ncbi:MAG: hypothetical protein ACI9YE_000411 [Psychroserpens sp.]|jgi:hypothetical protein
MKKAHFTDSQIMAILKQADNGVPIPGLCREHGMSNSSFYKWRTKYGGMDASRFEVTNMMVFCRRKFDKICSIAKMFVVSYVKN